MDWYSLFVTTEKEEYVSKWLKFYFSDQEMLVLIPKRKLIERRQGKRQLVLKKLFPGYVLLKTEMDFKKYYTLKKVPHLIKIVHSGEYFTKIPEREMSLLLQLMDQKGIVDFSKVYLTDSKIVIKSGPLVGMEGLIKAVDRRKMRIKIIVHFMGLARKIDVGIEMFDLNSVNDVERSII